MNQCVQQTFLRRTLLLSVVMMLGTGAALADNDWWAKQKVAPVWKSGQVQIDMVTYDFSGLDDYLKTLDIYLICGGIETRVFNRTGSHGKDKYGYNEDSFRWYYVIHDGKITGQWPSGDVIWQQINFTPPKWIWGMIKLRFKGRFAYEKDNSSGVTFDFTKDLDIGSTPRRILHNTSNPTIRLEQVSPTHVKVNVTKLPYSNMEELELQRPIQFRYELNNPLDGINYDDDGTVFTSFDLLASNRYYKAANSTNTYSFVSRLKYGTNTHEVIITKSAVHTAKPSGLTATYNASTNRVALAWNATLTGNYPDGQWAVFRRKAGATGWTKVTDAITMTGSQTAYSYTDAPPDGGGYTYAVSFWRNVSTWGGPGSAPATFSGGSMQADVTVPLPVTGVSLNKTALSLMEGNSETLAATLAPAAANNKKVTWKSDKTDIATVDANGKVTAVKTGTANITVTTDDGAKTATCTVTVTPKTISVTGVSLDKTTLSLMEGNSETLTATVAPATATNQKVTWKSDKTDIATVDASGKVTALKAGTANITVTTDDGAKTATCAVTVTPKTITVTGVTLNKTVLALIEGGTETLTANVAPENATNQKVTWKSDKTDIATVDANGKVTAVKTGTANITVTTDDGAKTATCTVTVSMDAGWINIAAIQLEASGQELKITVVGAEAAGFTKLYVNDKEIAPFTDGKVTVPIEDKMHIKATNADGATVVETWYNK